MKLYAFRVFASVEGANIGYDKARCARSMYISARSVRVLYALPDTFLCVNVKILYVRGAQPVAREPHGGSKGTILQLQMGVNDY